MNIPMDTQWNNKYTGAGIICGLEPSREGDNCVIVGAGYGLCSAGKGIEISENKEYIYYRLLKPADEHDLFQYFKGITKIYELLQVHQCGPETPEYSWIKKQGAADKQYLYLNDKIIVAYAGQSGDVRVLAVLRSELTAFVYKKPIPWDKIPCGNAPVGSGFNLWKKVKSTAAEQGISDYCLYNYLHPLMTLPVLMMRRFGYGSLDTANIDCDDDYKPAFCEAEPTDFNSFEGIKNEYKKLIGKALAQLDEALTDFHRYGGKWVGENAEEVAVSQLGALWQRWEGYCDAKNKDQYGIQYWYDLLRDLFDAWNELRAAALEYYATCFPDSNAFRRHLVLGGIPEERQPFYYDPLRTEFRQPPIFNGQANQLRKIRFLHWRMVIMIKSFFVPGADWDDTAIDTYTDPARDIDTNNPSGIQKTLPLRLTPSASPDQPLGKRAIPFYYDLAEHPQSLHWYWDYEATYGNRTDMIRSYHAGNQPEMQKGESHYHYAGTDADVYSQRPETIHPFIYDLRGRPFVRVEGLIGKVLIKSSDTYQIDGEFINLTGNVSVFGDLMKKYLIGFDVVFLEILSEKLCPVAQDHLCGVFQGGTFIIVLEKFEVEENGSTVVKYRVVADFTCNKFDTNPITAAAAMPRNMAAAPKEEPVAEKRARRSSPSPKTPRT